MEQRQEMNSLSGMLTDVKLWAQRDPRLPTLTKVAEAAGINRSIVSEIAGNKRVATPEQEKMLWAALESLGASGEYNIRYPESQQQELPVEPQASTHKQVVELYETEQYQMAMGWCDYIRQNRKMGVLIGHPGSGKTTILKEFVKKVPGAHYIECWKQMRMGDLLNELAYAAGVALNGNVYQRTQQVMRALARRDDVVLIFDEAEQMSKWDVDKFETLRKIWDNTGTPVIMAGTVQLRNLLIRGGGRDNLAQLYRRKYEFELPGINEKGARAILRDYNLTADAAAELTRIAADVKHGGMGNFVEILGLCLNVADGQRIDGGIVAGAKKYKMTY